MESEGFVRAVGEAACSLKQRCTHRLVMQSRRRPAIIAEQPLAWRTRSRLDHPASWGQSMRGILNIIIGVVFIVGGLSGHLVLIGTHNGPALAVVGGLLVAFGLFRLLSQR